MMHADILIIGAGITGSSIAYHLAAKGLKNIIVLDKCSQPGCGSTARATGGFRAQFGSAINIQLSLLSRERLLRFDEEHGIDPGYKTCGYLFLASGYEELDLLRQANSLQKENGLTEAEIISVDEISKLNTFINVRGIAGGAFCPTDGFISPVAMLEGYIRSAERMGVKYIFDTEITGISSTDGKITGIISKNNTFESEIVINAAGAWAGKISELAGVELPVTPLKRQVARVLEKNTLPENTPMTIWTDNCFHFRMRDQHLIMLLPEEPEAKDPFNTDIELNWAEKVFRIAKEKLPALENCGVDIKNSWAGLYEMTPDEHVLLGASSEFKNYYLACGSSGHGVMHSPAIGMLLAEIITYGKASSLDVHALRPERFIENDPVGSIEFSELIVLNCRMLIKQCSYF